MISLDIFATIAALAQISKNPERPLDGVNLMPYLTGTVKGDPHEAIYLRMFDKGAFAVRSGNLKQVIAKKGGEAELYDLSVDIGEKTDMAKEHAEKLKHLEKRREAWNSQLIPPAFSGRGDD